MNNEENDFDREEEVKRLQRERRSELRDLKKILSTPEGIRFFRRVMDEGKVFCTSFTGNSQTFFIEGKRALALWVLREIFEADHSKMAAVTIFDNDNADCDGEE